MVYVVLLFLSLKIQYLFRRQRHITYQNAATSLGAVGEVRLVGFTYRNSRLSMTVLRL
jgi:hypothetical protein